MNTTTDVKPIEVGSFKEIGSKIDASSQVEPNQLVYEVNALFQEAGHPKPELWSTFMAPNSGLHTDAVIQRFAINTALRLILSNYTEKSTIETRFCIIDDCNLHDWKRLLKSNVIKFFMDNKILF